MPVLHRDSHTNGHSIVHGISRGTSPMGSVTRDSGSGIYCPATLAEWTTTLSVAGIVSGNPTPIWLFQDASGNPTEVGGAFPLTASGTPSYRQAVSGWTRKAITFADASAGALASASASLPDLSTTSMLTLAWITLPGSNPVGTRNIISQGTDATPSFADFTTASKLFVKSGANTALGTSTISGAVRPIVIKHDRTNLVTTGYSDLEKVTPTFGGTSTGKALKFGGASNTSIAGGPLYGATFFAGAAELSDASIKTLLQTLGWTIAWT